MRTLVSRLRIQLDNLCQFLPQDRAAEFVRMSAVELLEATQRTVGTPEMLKAHMLLKQFGKEYLALRKQLEFRHPSTFDTSLLPFFSLPPYPLLHPTYLHTLLVVSLTILKSKQ